MKWKKLGKVFTPQEIKGRPWLKDFAQAPSTLIFDDFIRVYFSCRPNPDKNGKFVSYSAFVDLDKDDLFNIINVSKKPVMELGAKGCFDEFGTYPVSTIRERKEIWAYYGGWTRCESIPFNTAIGFAKSFDNGVSFERVGPGPILSYSINEPFNIGSVRVRKFKDIFYLFYVSGEKWIKVNNKLEMVLKIRMAKSSDGLNWKKHDKNLIKDLNNNESQASPDVFYHNNLYHMFFCNWSADSFRKTKSRKIGYAYSKDLKNWIRRDDKVGIDVSKEGWDSEMIAYPHVFKLNNKILMFYLGNDVGRYGFGLAQLDGDFDL